MAGRAPPDRLFARGLRLNLAEVLGWSWPFPASVLLFALKAGEGHLADEIPDWAPWTPFALLTAALPLAKLNPVLVEARAEQDTKALLLLGLVYLGVALHTAFWALLAALQTTPYVIRFIPLFVLLAPAFLFCVGAIGYEARSNGPAVTALLLTGPLALGFQIVALPLKLDGTVSWGWLEVLMPIQLLLGLAMGVGIGGTIVLCRQDANPDNLVFGGSATLLLCGFFSSTVMLVSDKHTTTLENSLPILGVWALLIAAYLALRVYFVGVEMGLAWDRFRERQLTLQRGIEERDKRALTGDGPISVPVSVPAPVPSPDPAGAGAEEAGLAGGSAEEYLSLVDSVEDGEAAAAVNAALQYLSNQTHQAAVKQGLQRLLLVLQQQPLQRIRPLRLTVISLVNWKKNSLGGNWDAETAAVYGRVLREFSGIQRAASHFLGLPRAPRSPSRRYQGSAYGALH